MRITLEQFQTDFVNGLDSVVVGAVWLQELLKERDRLEREVSKLQKDNHCLLLNNSRLNNRILEFELANKNIYILDTLAWKQKNTLDF